MSLEQRDKRDGISVGRYWQGIEYLKSVAVVASPAG